MALKANLLEKLRHVTNLPSPPSVALRIIELAEEEEPDIGEVAEVIASDAALASKVLRVANSAFYTQRRQTANLRQALLVLGLNATLTLTLGFSLVSSLRRSSASQLDYARFWRHSLLTATGCRVLSRHLGRLDVEEHFLAGLLHDIGMLVIDKAFPETYRDIESLQHDQQRLVELERERLGADHAQIGAWLLRTWNMPEILWSAIAASHDPDEAAANDEQASVARCVGLASELAQLWITPPEGREERCELMAAKAKKVFDFDADEVSTLLTEVRREVARTESLYEIALIDPHDAESILEQARELLTMRNLKALSEVSALKRETRTLSSRAQVLETESRTDPLTGVFNRGHLERCLEREFEAARKRDWPLSVIFADLDHFKSVNDIHGHAAGDEVLRNAAQLLLMLTRDNDIVARYGGEEFVIVLPATLSEGAERVARRTLHRFRETSHQLGGKEVKVTVSLGVATMAANRPFENMHELLGAADQAVYAAKQRRDTLVVHGSLAATSESEQPAAE